MLANKRSVVQAHCAPPFKLQAIFGLLFFYAFFQQFDKMTSMLKKIFCLLLILMLSGCQSSTIANPWIDYASIAQAKKNPDFLLVDVPETYEGEAISYIGYLADGDLSEVIYGDQYCVLRAAKGKADISGDYNDYARKDKRTLNGVKVELFAISDNKSVDCYNLAKWHKGQYSYSMHTENGMSLKAIEKYMERLSYGSTH